MDFIESVPVVPSGSFGDAWEDAADGCRQRSEHWGDEESGPRHELVVDAGQLRVVGELPRQSAEDRFACFVGFVEKGVGVWEQRVANVHDAARGFGSICPAVGFLGDGVAVVVVSLRATVSP